MPSKKRAEILALSGMLALLLAVSGCQPDRVEVEYQPPYIPVKFVIDSQGRISAQGETSLVTSVGVFSVDAEYELRSEGDSLLVVIRDRRKGAVGFDTIYRVRSGRDEFVAVVNGRTTVQIANRQVLIDVTDGSIESIEFKKASEIITEATGDFWEPFPLGYHPFALASWAYDDSTIDKWYGFGFLWFLVRLVLAIFLLVPDLILTVVLGIGVLLHSFFGETTRNIFFGLLTLTVIFSATCMTYTRIQEAKKEAALRAEMEAKRKAKRRWPSGRY